MPTFDRSNALRSRFHELIPGGSHTYAKSDDQYPEGMSPYIVSGKGSHVFDLDGNEFIEYGRGPAFCRSRPRLRTRRGGRDPSTPARVELRSACGDRARMRREVPGTHPQCRDGQILQGRLGRNLWSREARPPHTGRDRIAICGSQPFFAVDDWFIGTSQMPGIFRRSFAS